MRVLIFQQRGWGIKFGHYFATQIKKEYPGAVFAAMVFKKTTLDFIEKQKDIDYEQMVFFDDVQNSPEKYIADNITLNQICEELDIKTVWPLVQSLRNHVKDYSKKYYYSFRQQASDELIKKIIKATFVSIKELVDTFQPDIIISPNYVALPHIMMSIYAKKNGVKMIAITDTKVKGVNIWVSGYQENEGIFFDCFRAYEKNFNSIDMDVRLRAEKYLHSFRKHYIMPDYFEKKVSKSNVIKGIKNASDFKEAIKKNKTLKAIFLFLRGNKTPGIIDNVVTLDNRGRYFIARDYFSELYYTSKLNKWNFDKVNNHEEYVYFPLQFQPEASLDVIAPLFNNQIEVARQIAMALPGDLILVVKEHPAMLGKRPPSYLEKIQKLPNVKFVDYRLKSYDLMKKAKAVVSINSTACIEAAFLGTPVIQLGDLGTPLLLPHVKKCTDFSKLPYIITKHMSTDFRSEEYDKILIAYIAAAYKVGFETNYAGMWEHGETGDVLPIWEKLNCELKYLKSMEDNIL